jgi:hypothetical protein
MGLGQRTLAEDAEAVYTDIAGSLLKCIAFAKL